MKSAPNSKANLDRAIQRYAGSDARAVSLRVSMANAIVAQMIGHGVVKGGSGLKFRYGEEATRVTLDLDTAWNTDLDSFLKDLNAKLKAGWNEFDGVVIVQRQASPKGIPFDYVMQPCDVKLNYNGTPWFTVKLEIGHNEIGDADEVERVPLPEDVAEVFEFLCLPRPGDIPAMRLEFQIAQKIHGASAPNSKRAHDLIDLQLVLAHEDIDFEKTADICRRLFAYRKVHAWPPRVEQGETWEEVYRAQSLDLDVLPTVDEAIAWANDLIAKIDQA